MKTLWLAMLAAVLQAALVCPAQKSVTAASLSGQVMDSAGAVIPGADVQALAVATGQSRTTKTDERGRFRLSYLPLGAYKISARAHGFARVEQRVELSVGSAFEIAVRLPVAGREEEVVVTAAVPVIEESRSQISETVMDAESTQLPFPGRNTLDLALLLPGVSPTNTGSTQTLAETSEVVGQGYSINSQRNFSNNFVVDGLSNNDDAAGVAGSVLGMDVVREFQVVTSGGQAEFGRALGGYMNVATKSGTNDLHGTAYGYLRNQRLNAMNALSRTKLPLTQGEYGASLSGPLKRDKAFFFGNFEEQRLRTDGVVTVLPANAVAINSRLAAVGYQAPLLPVGTSSTTLYPTTLHTDTAFFRADERLGNRDQLTARYSFYKLSSLNARGNGGLNEVSNGTSVFDTSHVLAISNIVSVSSRTFNETRGQFVDDDLAAPPNDQIGPAVTISGVAVFGRSTSSPTSRSNRMGELVDNLVLNRGSQSVKVGADWLYNDDSITYPQSLRGAYSFASLAAFLQGTYNTQGYTQNFGSPTVRQSNVNLGLYVQDEWKLAQRVTLNAGGRYDLERLRTIATDTNNVAPRIGVAWSPYANGRTVVRASYGLFYDRIPLRPLANALLSANNTLEAAQAQFLSYTFSPSDTNAPLFPAVAKAPPSGAKLNYTTMDRHIQNSYSQQTSLGVEQEFWEGGTLGVSYQHVRGEHLIGAINRNINSNGSRPDPTHGNVKPYSSLFDSYFDGLEVSFLERPSAWGWVRLSYTWSKAIDNVGEFFFSTPINNFDLRVDRARSDDDQRHRVVFESTLMSPSRASSRWKDHLTHGWRLSGVLQYYSAPPFNVTTGSNTKQGTVQRPCAPGYSLSATGGTNPCTEALRGAVIGRNAGAGFDFLGLNARLSRTLALTERVKLDCMAEAFNSLNHRNDLIPNGTFGASAYPGSAANPSFGKPTAVGDPRHVQLAIRLNF